jgi:hypothetical protein
MKLGKYINSESGFVMGLAALCWGYSKTGALDVNTFLIFVQGLIALCGGFWWKRNAKYKLGIKNGGVSLGEPVDPKV